MPGHPFTEIRELYSYRGSLWIGTLTSGCFYLDEPPGKEAAVHPFKIKAGVLDVL
ncbi:MAG: hypothetical protein IPG38_05360 [Chitinophagaceae bacterium]|nr:hypothetical protein [Chitinophagaceae bacterium]